jgi:hypothetical protein
MSPCLSSRATFAVLSAFPLITALGFGQAFTGTFSGVVQDSSQSAVPGASVSIRNMNTNEIRRLFRAK